MIVLVKTPLRRYAVRYDDVMAIKLVGGPADIEALGTPERPCAAVDLGQLLDDRNASALTRRRALLVPLRRRYVAFLVDMVDAFVERPQVHPLPDLLRRRLAQPWAIGALLDGEELIVQLDLRALARSVLAQRA